MEFDKSRPRNLFEDHFAFKWDLETLLGRPVDLVERRVIRNPYFLERINSGRLALYAA